MNINPLASPLSDSSSSGQLNTVIPAKNFAREISKVGQGKIYMADKNEICSNKLLDNTASQTYIYDKNANIIKRFLRKAVAAQSYAHMFSNGSYFKKNGRDDIGLYYTPKQNGNKASFSALEHFNKTSEMNLKMIAEKTKNLTPQEKALLEKVRNLKLHYRHQTNHDLSDKVLTLSSCKKLQHQRNIVNTNTCEFDRDCLSNDDFVFFGVEFYQDENALPLHTQHAGNDYGAVAYLLEDKYPYGYLTLSDHYHNHINIKAEQLDILSTFPELKEDIQRHIGLTMDGYCNAPLYNVENSKTALGLHLISFLRECKSTAFKNFALNPDIGSKELDTILNSLFQPEFHIPRMVSTTNFKKVKLREMTLHEAVLASNIPELSTIIKSKEDAYDAMIIAAQHPAPEVLNYLSKHWASSFTYENINYLMLNKDELYSAIMNNSDIPPGAPTWYRKN